jgi:hypothetical protein
MHELVKKVAFRRKQVGENFFCNKRNLKKVVTRFHPFRNAETEVLARLTFGA